MAQSKDQAYVEVFFIRNGKLIERDRFIVQGAQDEEPGQIMTSFLNQFYDSATYNPPLREIRPTWILQVWVVNTSSVPVFIKSVGLMYVARETAGAYIIRQRSEGDNLLAAGDERYYALFGNDYDDLPDLATLPRDSVFIDVATPEKTILRVPGGDIMFIRSAHPEDGSASPPA